jgi:branched-chain amino acid transport system permease protein
MEFVTVSLLNGVVYGLLLFMVSAGLTLIFGMMGILNMAHASFYMIGAYTGYAVSSEYSFVLGLLLAPIVAGFIGWFMERYLLRTIHEYGHGHQLMFTFGFAFVVVEIVKLMFGNFTVNYSAPQVLNFSAFRIFLSCPDRFGFDSDLCDHIFGAHEDANRDRRKGGGATTGNDSSSRA